MAAAAATIDIDASGATTVVALDSRERYSLMHDGDSVSDQLQRHNMKDWVLLSIDEDVLHGDDWKEHDVVHAVPPGHVPSGSTAVAANVALQDISLTVNIEPDFNLLKNSLGKEWTAPQVRRAAPFRTRSTLSLRPISHPRARRASVPWHASFTTRCRQ